MLPILGMVNIWKLFSIYCPQVGHFHHNPEILKPYSKLHNKNTKIVLVSGNDKVANIRKLSDQEQFYLLHKTLQNYCLKALDIR